MTLFLRDENNDNLVDIEVYRGENGLDCSSVVDVEYFARKLEQYKSDEMKETFIGTMKYFQEIREMFHHKKKNDSQKELMVLTNVIREQMIEAAKMFDLYYVED